MTLNNRHILVYLAIVFLFSSWIIFYTMPRLLQYPLLLVPALLIILYKYHPYKKNNFLAFILFGIVFFRFAIPNDADVTSPYLYTSMFRSLLLSSIFLIDRDHLVKVYEYFLMILAPILAVSLFFYLLKTSGLVNISPITTFIGPGEEGRLWNVYYLFSLQVNFLNEEIIRFPGIFDEPGYLGTLLAFILGIEKFNLKPWWNKLFLFSGILTFSLAFYILSAIYIIFSLHVKIRHKLYLAVLGAVMLAAGLIFYQDVFYERVYERVVTDDGLRITQDGRVGLERQEATIEGLAKLETIKLLFGAGHDAHQDIQFAPGVTWERLIFQLGIVFTMLLVFLIIFFSSHSRQTLLFSAIFILSLIQRPAIFTPIWIFILAVGIHLNENKKKM